MTLRPMISVAMATYNGQRYLEAQLESLARQTLLPAELVITDDGSTDQTLAIAERFAAAAPFPVRIHRNPQNLGFSDNFLKACRLAKGSLIALCDQDDVWHPEKLARCAEAFKDPEVLALMHTGQVVDADLRPLGATTPALPRSETLMAPWGLAPRMFPAGFAMVLSAGLIRGLDHGSRPRDWRTPTDLPLAHDQWLYMLARAMGKVVHLDEPLVRYRQHQANTCGAPRAESLSGQLARARATGGAHYRRLAEIFDEYAALMGGLAARRPAAASRLAEAERLYRRLARVARGRAALHEGPAPARWRALAGLIARGAYLPGGDRPTGPASLPKDMWVLAGGLLPKVGPRAAAGAGS